MTRGCCGSLSHSTFWTVTFKPRRFDRRTKEEEEEMMTVSSKTGVVALLAALVATTGCGVPDTKGEGSGLEAFGRTKSGKAEQLGTTLKRACKALGYELRSPSSEDVTQPWILGRMSINGNTYTPNLVPAGDGEFRVVEAMVPGEPAPEGLRARILVNPHGIIASTILHYDRESAVTQCGEVGIVPVGTVVPEPTRKYVEDRLLWQAEDGTLEPLSIEYWPVSRELIEPLP